jgi:hypothetical protein
VLSWRAFLNPPERGVGDLDSTVLYSTPNKMRLAGSSPSSSTVAVRRAPTIDGQMSPRRVLSQLFDFLVDHVENHHKDGRNSQPLFVAASENVSVASARGFTQRRGINYPIEVPRCDVDAAAPIVVLVNEL